MIADDPRLVSRRVVFRRFGGPEVLEIEHRPIPVPGTGEVLVRVAAAGVNPVDWKIFSGLPLHDAYERTLPSGNGYDFAGTIAARGDGVEGWRIGDRVFGGLRFHAQADHLVIDPRRLVRMPHGLSFLAAGALNVVGRTAVASVESQHLGPDDVVLVSGAAGGVGIVTAQLAVRQGAQVHGTASQRNHAMLRRLGIRPIAYGPSLERELRAAAPQGFTAVLDTVGHGTVELALSLGVPPERINTIADYEARKNSAVAGVGGAAAGAGELAQIAQLIADGVIELPIDSVHPLGNVREAYARSIAGHATGKIVLTTASA
ncbi:Narbonolide/10-deoxymethynolide synthase PikA2, modules 3 and 4 [Microbacterium oxydans]|uniref:NADP-dependent oxidoreductase n=1 Tax=Microbacterium oxydans TaxID=82380 RepID=UPI001D48F8CE|nr:NADP-dependent oxidoreductase [Microbacterium oxydans]CAH0205229.1 Narbonolide/10-deoxymethynolide synthase PikA2, modules 3 and 4 [Microbacterium oxydans]